MNGSKLTEKKAMKVKGSLQKMINSSHFFPTFQNDIYHASGERSLFQSRLTPPPPPPRHHRRGRVEREERRRARGQEAEVKLAHSHAAAAAAATVATGSVAAGSGSVAGSAEGQEVDGSEGRGAVVDHFVRFFF